MSTVAGYDYIIVGAGSAGCVLANRLTEGEGATVLLLEAGGSDNHPYIQVPIGVGKIRQEGLFNWGYETEPEPHLNGRRVPLFRGKVVGGSSSVNMMVYTRGHRADYDRWARNGATGWAYADLLPYFRKSKSWEDGEDPWRGASGPLSTQWSHVTDPLFDACREAAIAAGWPAIRDFNGADGEGIGGVQRTVGNGRRASASVAYLKPILKRPGLTLLTGAMVSRVILRGTAATGVEFVHQGKTQQAEAAREVILCGGVFNSPQVLMLSGIGPAAHLRDIGIEARADLPVGQNLQDHLMVRLEWLRSEPGPFHQQMRLDRTAINMARAWLFGTGPGTVLPFGLMAFFKTRPELEAPDIEFIFRAAPWDAHPWFPGWQPAYRDGYSISPVLLHPRSQGEVTLRSANPAALVRIRNNFLAEPEDLAALREAFHRGRELGNQTPLDRFRGPEIAPGPSVRTDAEIDAWIRNTAVTVAHPLGTCAMGHGAGTVVDPMLKVHGIEGLRVVDASVFPDLPSAHINAAVMAVAERASDLIRGRPPLAPVNV